MLYKTNNTPPLILIADDDESMRLLITSALESGGFRTHAVDNGKSALAAYELHQPDLLMLDVDMPDMNGFEVCRRLRAEGNTLLPIVIVTGSEDTASIDTAFDVGATDFIAKPVNWSLLSHRVRYILRGSVTRHALNASESRNRALVDALPDELFILDKDGVVEYAVDNKSNTSIDDPMKYVGSFFAEALPSTTADQFATAFSRTLEHQQPCILEFSRGAALTQDARECRLLPHENGKVLVVIRDVTEIKQAAARIEELAYFDTLTGQTNRHLFMEKITEAANEHDSERSPVSLIYIGLDRFKRINDSLGHKRGDLILSAIANRIAEEVNSIISDNDKAAPRVTLGRIVGDEFALLVPGLDTRGAYDLANKVLQSMIKPLAIDHLSLVVTASVGVASLPKDTDTAATLLQKAEVAMQHAKTAGRNTIRSYTQAMDVRADSQLKLESELRIALDNDHLELYFQPKFACDDLALCGAEALLRWQHPELGSISPGEFIPLAEATGLIHEVDQWVLNEVCEHVKSWTVTDLAPPRISLNLSATEFCRPDAHQLISEKIATHQILPGSIEIELTEGAFMEDVEAAKSTLRALKQAGLFVSIDDFGTGYSSLAYLKQFPVDVLKIDRTFVDQVDADFANQSICRAVISLAHGLGLKVVAEGVETAAQHEFLRNEGCDQIQGYWSGRPMPAADFAQLLTTASRSARA